MESSNGTNTVCTSACVGNVDFDSRGECFLSEILPLDTSTQPSQLIPSTDLVAHCKSSNSGVQFLPPDKEAYKKTWCILLVGSCNSYCGNPDLCEIRTRYALFNISIVSLKSVQ
jgi:hypothetical protein